MSEQDNRWQLDWQQQWQAGAKNYKTKSLIYMLCQMNGQQNKRLEILRGQLDGQMWSPRDWKN